MLLKNKLDELKTSLNTNNVLATLEERYCYSKDASNIVDSYKIPDLVVFVETIEDVQNVVRYANEHEIPIIPRGAGTNMVGSCTCNQGGIVLNFSKMNKILEINTVNMTARVQPGVVLGDLKNSVALKGLFFPPDPSNFKVSTIGGGIAQASGGAMALKYGTMKEYVLSLKIVNAQGELITLGSNTIKDAFGYHLAQLMIGSEGTLGIIVEAVVKLINKPESRSLLTAYYTSTERAVKAVNNITSSGICPATIDFMDKASISVVESFEGFKLEPDFDCVLIIELHGLKSSMNEQVEKIISALNKSGASKIELANDEKMIQNIWDARRASYAAVTRLAPDVVTDDIIVPRENLFDLINGCEQIAEKYNLKLCLVGHIGDGNIHPQIALDLQNSDEYKNFCRAKSEIYQLTSKLNGTISAEHGVGLDKKTYFKHTIDSTALEYMKFIKKSFDPKNILNPGKIFDL